MNNIDGLTTAQYGEWMASLFGACMVSFVLGIWLKDLFEPYALIILVVGVALHGFGMLRMYRRNK